VCFSSFYALSCKIFVLLVGLQHSDAQLQQHCSRIVQSILSSSSIVVFGPGVGDHVALSLFWCLRLDDGVLVRCGPATSSGQ